MQWLTMSMPTPWYRPSRAASSTLVPTPSVLATSTGWSIAFERRAAERSAEAADAAQHRGSVRALDRGAHRVDRAGALVDVDACRGVRRDATAAAAFHAMSRRTCIPSKRDRAPSARRRSSRASARSAPSPVTARTRPPATLPSSTPPWNTQRTPRSVVVARILVEAGDRRRRARGASGSRAPRRRRCTRRDRLRDARAAATPSSSPRQQASASSARSSSSSGSTACASGSPNRQLNSSRRGPSAVSISPAYSTPTYGVPCARRWSSTGWMNVAVSSSAECAHGGRRVRAHPAGVRAGVGLADPLVVLRDRQRQRRASRRRTPSGCTRDRSGAPRRRSVPARRASRIAASVSAGCRRDDDALARGEPVELDDDGPAELAPPLDRVVVVVAAEELRRRDAELRGERACVALRRLQPGELRRRPEAGDAGCGAVVGDARRRVPPPGPTITRSTPARASRSASKLGA